MPEGKKSAGIISARFSKTELVERIIEGERHQNKYLNEIEGFRSYHSAREYARRLKEKLRN
jgi:hypothetical protein